MKNVRKLLLLSCAATSLALAQGTVEGEKWKITSSMQMSGMSLPGNSSEICKQPGEDAVPIKTENNCEIYDVNRSGNVQSFKMRCTGEHAAEGSAQFTYLGPDHYQGKMQITTQGETMNMTYEGQKLGKCDGREMNLQAKKMLADAQKQQAAQDKMMVEECHKIAADASSVTFMQTTCKDPADLRTFCDAVKTHDKFKDFAEREQVAHPAAYGADAHPLTESAKMCGFTVDAQREMLCKSAEQGGNLQFIASQCPIQGAAIASAQCAGRRYTTINPTYRGFCATYARNQAQAQQTQEEAQPQTPMDKTKGLFNQGKKALGGLFRN